MKNIQSKVWSRSDQTILGEHQPVYLSNIMAAEIFTDMAPLINDSNMTLKNFVEDHFKKRLKAYPIR